MENAIITPVFKKGLAGSVSNSKADGANYFSCDLPTPTT